MVDKNTLVNEVIVDRSPQAADFMLEKTTDSRSPGTQKCDIQEINEDNRQTHKIYHCGTVNMNMNSFNARGIRMENCGNKVRASQVPICSSLFLSLIEASFLSSRDFILSDHRVSGNEKNDENPYLQPHAVSSDGMWVLAISY